MAELLLLYFLNQDSGKGTHSFFSSGESQLLCGGGFDGNIVLVGSNDFGQAFLDGRNVGIDFRALSTHRGVKVSKAVTLGGNQFHGAFQYNLTVHIERGLRSVRPMITDIAHVGGS